MTLRRLLLRPLTPLYRLTTGLDRWAKQKRAFHSRLPVISVGNISSGGTGKTQVVAWLVQQLQERYPALILSRGYGRTGRKDLLLRPGDVVNPDIVGDEPALLLARLDRGAVGVARNRSRLLHQLESSDEFRGAVVVLDDGFQHWRIVRDFDIVVVDTATVDGSLIPAGDLREPHEALRRADLLIATSDRAEEFLLQRHESSRVVRLRQSYVRFSNLDGECNPSELGPLLAVAGIARPERFLQTLRDAGVAVENSLLFGDHVRYREREIESILSRLNTLGARIVVTTSKDAVKLSRVPRLAQHLCVVEIGIEFDREEEVIERIEEVVEKRSRKDRRE